MGRFNETVRLIVRLIVNMNAKPLQTQLQRLTHRLDDLTPVMHGIGGILETSTTDRIRSTKTAPDGTRWAEWSQSTRQAKARMSAKQRGSLLLVRGKQSGLLGSITYEASKNSVIVGSVMYYAAYLQQGTSRMPARPFLGLSAQDYRTIDDLLHDYITGKVTG